jgi:hypothetical protein
MSKAVKIVYKVTVKPVVVYGSETYGYEKTEYMGEENIREDMWTSGRTSDMKNKH